MTDTIEREAAITAIHRWLEDIFGIDDVECTVLNKRLNAIPAADVRPVRHGKWIPVTNGRGGSECNQCHAYAPSHQCGVEYQSKYCPNCGALMDKGGDGDGV